MKVMFIGRAMLSPTVVPVSLVGAIIDRPHQSASVNVPSVSVGRVDVNPKTRVARFEDPVVVSPPPCTA